MNTLSIIAGLSKYDGGTSYSVPAWCNVVGREGIRRYLMALKTKDEISEFLDLSVVELTLLKDEPIFGVKYSSKFEPTMRDICLRENINLLHNHGVWLPANHSCSRISKKLGIPLIITPHGMLTQWAINYKPWKKKIAWILYQKHDIETANLIHVTSVDEGIDLRKLGSKNRIAVVPNGIDLPDQRPRAINSSRPQVALFVSRINPKKGLINLVKAWAQAKPKDWKMVIVGPDEGGHRREVERVVSENGLESCFEFTGPLFNNELREKYLNADLFILPTMSENFGNVIPEALSYGVPVITTHGAPWEELHSWNCGWWIPIGVPSLVNAIKEAIEMSAEERSEMGKNGRRLVEDRYTWPSSAKKMKALYEWVLGGNKPPDVEFVK